MGEGEGRLILPQFLGLFSHSITICCRRYIMHNVKYVHCTCRFVLLYSKYLSYIKSTFFFLHFYPLKMYCIFFTSVELYSVFSSLLVHTWKIWWIISLFLWQVWQFLYTALCSVSYFTQSILIIGNIAIWKMVPNQSEFSLSRKSHFIEKKNCSFT